MYILFPVINRKCGPDKQSGQDTGIYTLGDELQTVKRNTTQSYEVCTRYAFPSFENDGILNKQRKDIIDYGNSESRPIHIEICQCTPNTLAKLDRQRQMMHRDIKTSFNILSKSGCNGPRSGIETHSQGLKCWTCGETVDAIDCTKFPHYSRYYQDNEEASGSQELDIKGKDNAVSANQDVITYPDIWTKECLKNDRYCVVQFIIDQYGNNRKPMLNP